MSRRFVAPLVVAAAVAGGGVAGAALGVPGLSGAQETDSTPPTEVPALPDGAVPEPPQGAPRGDGGFAAAADALGMSVKDLATELRAGKTIAQVAQEKSVDVNKVIDAMVAKAVATGRDEAEARGAITEVRERGTPGHGGVHHLRPSRGSAPSSMRRPRRSASTAARSCRSCKTARRSRRSPRSRVSTSTR